MGSAYEAEAELIHQGMQELLWVKEQGAYRRVEGPDGAAGGVYESGVVDGVSHDR